MFNKREGRVTIQPLGGLSRAEVVEAISTCSRHPKVKQLSRLDKDTNSMVFYCPKCEDDLRDQVVGKEMAVPVGDR